MNPIEVYGACDLKSDWDFWKMHTNNKCPAWDADTLFNYIWGEKNPFYN